MAQPGVPQPRDVQDIIATRMAGDMQPVAPEADTRPTEGDAATRITESAPADPAATRITEQAPTDPDATRPSTGGASRPDAPTMIGSDPGSGTHTRTGTGRFTGSFTRLGRTRTNASLPRDTQQLDLKLQLSRPSVLSDLGKAGPGAIPPGIQKLIDEHGTEGRYAVDKPLAQGGMGAVLLIKDGDFQRPAAMKVMLSQYARSPEALERFLAEAQVTAQLEHPNIVPIHDLGIMEDGTVYFTMKFIEGESLGSVVKRLRSDDPVVADAARTEWPDERILLTFLKVLDGMGYAHAKGVVHRDIKPDNIMLGSHGEVLVVDWGIAKVLGRDDHGSTVGVVHLRDEDAVSLTREGSAMGTLYYMPPEQARGELTAIDARSDVYALGATLYELLTRKRPVAGASAADIIAKVVNGELTPIKESRPDLPDDLAAIVMKSLAFQPERRYPRCTDMAEDVRRYLAGQAVAARRRNLIERLGAWVSRHRRQVAAGAAVAALVAASIGGALWWGDRERQRQADLRLAEGEAHAAAARWDEARDAAGAVLLLRAGDPAAADLRERAAAALAVLARERDEATRAEADLIRAQRLVAEAGEAATVRDWATARDKAQASLEAMPTPEAQELLATATAALADARRAELERTAAARKAEGDVALAAARALPPLDASLGETLARAREAYAQSAADGIAIAGVDASLAELGALQARADAAREANARQAAERAEAERRRQQADEAIAAAEAALATDLDAAAEQIAAARRLAPGDEGAEALRERIAAALRERDAARGAEAARIAAREAAAEALTRARTAEAAMHVAVADLAARRADIERLQSELASQPLERKTPLFTARAAAEAAAGRIAEQWALAEGAARSAFDALAGEPAHADAAAARNLLAALYLNRLEHARSTAALPEVAAFTNLLARLGIDVSAAEPGRLVLDGPPTDVTARPLIEDSAGRLVPATSPPIALRVPNPGHQLPAGRWQLTAGDDLACVVIPAGGAARLAWTPAQRPQIPGVRLRWVPAEPGFWLAEDEVTVAQYAEFLADPAITARVKRAWRSYQLQESDQLSLLPRSGGAVDEAVWQVLAADQAGLELASWTPVASALREPVRGVSRDDAQAFCAWLSAKTGRTVRLPTLAERRFAAHGGDRRRVHPWGPGFDHALATSALPHRRGPPAVGSSPADRGPFGHRDLAGSVREWVSDAGLAHPARIAGGGWTDESPERLRSDAVESVPPDATFAAIGFRILVTP